MYMQLYCTYPKICSDKKETLVKFRKTPRYGKLQVLES